MVYVDLNWQKIDWKPSDTWAKDTVPKLKECGLKLGELRRSVYVIRLNGNYCIHYPKGQSPAIYIGEGRFSQRIYSHRSWVKELEDLVRNFSFEIRVAVPRVRNSEDAYKDAEAALLIQFAAKFGSAPLWNKQFENRLFDHYEYRCNEMDSAICKGGGKKYKWEIKPMKASMFYKSYNQA